MVTTSHEPVHAELLIGGSSRRTAETIPVVNPADTRDTVGTIPRATPEDVARATSAAADAFPTWSRTPMRERAQVLRAAAEALQTGIDARAELLVRESSALIGESRSSTARQGTMLEWYAGVGETFEEVTEPPSPNGVVQVAREPMGVAVLIVPWNSPTTLGFLGLATRVDMPFGGFKQSGIGRSHGVVALEEQLELHTISSRQPGGRS